MYTSKVGLKIPPHAYDLIGNWCEQSKFLTNQWSVLVGILYIWFCMRCMSIDMTLKEITKFNFVTGIHLEVFRIVTFCIVGIGYQVTPPSSGWRWRWQTPPRNVDTLPQHCRASQPRRPGLESSPPWKTSTLWYGKGRVQAKYLDVLPGSTVMSTSCYCV